MTDGPAWKNERLKLLERQASAKRRNRLLSFAPYPKQRLFFDLGADHRERLFMAGNQCGKSEAGAFEMALHLTGLYPHWWEGKRFDHPVKAWAAGEGGLQARDICQAKLCGLPGSEADFGTGMIPKALLLGRAAGHGVTDLYDNIRVQHATGGVSTLAFKTYEQGRSKWQGATLDVVWCDEESPIEIYSEALARLTGDGIIFTTFTPLNGFNQVVPRFLRDDSPEARRDRAVVKMGLKDAEHFSEEEKDRRLAGYPAHERAARANGDPLLGSGAVFEEVVEADITTSMRLSDVPSHFPLLWGIDFGIAHPFAAVLLAWDRDGDCIYVLHTYRISNAVPAQHAAAMNRVARNVPVAWPHDGDSREKGSGESLRSIYKKEGLRMLMAHASFKEGGYKTEPGVLDLLTRMRSGRFKVSAHLVDWFDEFRSYHRKDGLIVKLNDDLLSATRIGCMDIRHAQILGDPRTGYANLGAERRRPAEAPPSDPWTGRPLTRRSG